MSGLEFAEGNALVVNRVVRFELQSGAPLAVMKLAGDDLMTGRPGVGRVLVLDRRIAQEMVDHLSELLR